MASYFCRGSCITLSSFCATTLCFALPSSQQVLGILVKIGNWFNVEEISYETCVGKSRLFCHLHSHFHVKLRMWIIPFELKIIHRYVINLRLLRIYFERWEWTRLAL
jgi:hypothetical protein